MRKEKKGVDLCFLSSIGDTEDMTRNALKVLDKDNLPTFKANAVARAKEFDISKILPKYEAYYTTIIEKVTSKTLKLRASLKTSEILLPSEKGRPACR